MVGNGASGLFRLAPGAAGCGPAFDVDLFGAADGEGVGGDVFGDAGTRADVGSIADGDGRDERGVAADERGLANARDVLVDAVVVAGDGSGADVGAFADFAVTEVGEMVGFGSLTEARLFHFDEVADVSVFADLVSGAQVGERPEARAIRDGGILEDAALKDLHAIAEGAVFDDGKGADAAAGAHPSAAQQLREWLNDRARSDFNIGIDDTGVGAVDGDAGSNEARGRGVLTRGVLRVRASGGCCSVVCRRVCAGRHFTFSWRIARTRSGADGQSDGPVIAAQRRPPAAGRTVAGW